MNRTTSLFLALGILLAHVVAIHHDEVGRFAGAFDESHVAYRLARNLMRNGLLSWNTTTPSFDAYPSLLWVLVCYLPERRWYPDPSLFCQVVGVLSALMTCVVLCRFSRNRLSGMTAPMLFAFSGSVASTAASGTEIPMLGLWVTASFLSFERRRRLPLAVFLVLATLTRLEGALFALLLFVMELGLYVSKRRNGGDGRVSLAPYVPAAIAACGICLLRHSWTGLWLSPALSASLSFDAERAALGSGYFLDFLFKSGSAWLVVFPLFFLVTGKLVGTAGRAFWVAIAWFALVVWQGGSSMPFWGAMAPVLPIFFLSIQEGVTRAIDMRRGSAALTWCAFLLALLLSAVASKKPASLGSIDTLNTHFAWMEPSPGVREAYDASLGREGLRSDIRRTESLRAIGQFMREEFDPEYTVATLWPGAIGYQSRRSVHDILGRTTLLPGMTRLQPWFGNHRVDLVAMLESSPDHVVLTFDWLMNPFETREMFHDWLGRWDVEGDTPERWRSLMRAVREYELVTIPIRDRGDVRVSGAASPFTLLRRKSIGLAPRLEIALDPEGGYRVLAHHDGYEQLVDLEVLLLDDEGREWSMEPTGRFVEGSYSLARSMLLLHRTKRRPIELAHGAIPADVHARELSARLINPGMPANSPVAAVGDGVRVQLR